MVPVCGSVLAARLEEPPRLRGLRWSIKSGLKCSPAYRERWAKSGSFSLDPLWADRLRRPFRVLDLREDTGREGIHTLDLGFRNRGMRWTGVEPCLQASATGMGLSRSLGV